MTAVSSAFLSLLLFSREFKPEEDLLYWPTESKDYDRENNRPLGGANRHLGRYKMPTDIFWGSGRDKSESLLKLLAGAANISPTPPFYWSHTFQRFTVDAGYEDASFSSAFSPSQIKSVLVAMHLLHYPIV